MSVPEVVQRLVRAWDVHDVDLLMACYAPGAVVHPHGPDSPVPVAAWRDALPTFVGSFPDLGLQLEGTVAEGDRAVAEVRMTGTNTAALHLGEIDRLLLRTEATELPATYGSIDLRWVVVLELSDGLVATERHHWPYVDTLLQLGLLPVPATAS